LKYKKNNIWVYDILKGRTRWSLKVIIGLLVIVFLMLPFSFIGEPQSSININEVAKFDMGKTVFAGEDVIEDSKINKYPITTNIGYLYERLKTLDFLGVFIAISTGVVPLPISEFTAGGISDTGFAKEFSGPGVLTEENNKLIVKSPDDFVWGYKVPYTKAVKTENGINIVEEDKTVKTIAKEDINNDTVSTIYVSGDTVSKWFNKSKTGESINLNYGLGNFSDNRTLIKPDEIKPLFGEEVFNYTYKYSSGNPVMVFMKNYDEIVAADSYSYLGSYPQYNNANRAYNAKQFTKAWNNTIIPPNSTSSGTEITGFAVSADPEAPGGFASHGVCPPARALRSVASAMGFSLPTGMNWGRDAVNFGVNPGSGIKVTNNNDYPVRIIMWTEGEGTGIVIYAKMIKLIPAESFYSTDISHTIDNNTTDNNTINNN